MDKQQKKRIKNILSGDITNSTGVTVGYRKKYIERKEGDKWEEDGKTWTIQNGVKQTISVLSDMKNELLMPMFCPKCENIMNKQKDKTVWRQFGFCLDCLVEEDTKQKIAGTFEEKEKQIVETNIQSWKDEMIVALKEFLDVADSNYYVTEAGDVEDWSMEGNKHNLKKIIDKTVKELETKDGNE